MPEEIKNQVLKNRSDLLSKVKRYTDTKLNSSKKSFYDSTRSDYEVVKTIEEILSLLEISEDKLDNFQQMKSVAQTYVNKRECSIQ